MLHPFVAEEHDGLLHRRDAGAGAVEGRTGDAQHLARQGDIPRDRLLQQADARVEIGGDGRDRTHVAHEGWQVGRRPDGAHKGEGLG
ncbi:MAG: hypothetical protein U5K74_11890 [Gemmatimonadaceae bacterium]|nr:hypothetical protein [Gemmatimonadaceae bacterium]